ncbi:MAG TPA: hypothetical protein VMM93_12160, partial [Vicinamibacterales bacterium]|nr:hypothetical protein [Vicinamibacterales bacterium]
MKRQRLVAVLAVLVAVIAFAPVGAQSGKRPLGLEDILAFRALGQTALSPDGAWFAYRMAPLQGDSEVIVKSTSGDREMTFAVGDGGGAMSFSEDSRWLALTTALPRRDAEAARRASRPVQNSVTLVNLATGDKTVVDKVRRHVFNGEMGGWIALDRYPASAAAGTPAPAAGGRGGRGGGAA